MYPIGAFIYFFYAQQSLFLLGEALAPVNLSVSQIFELVDWTSHLDICYNANAPYYAPELYNYAFSPLYCRSIF